MGFALNLNRLRLAADMTQEQLGGMIDPPKSQSAVASWESGRATPKMKVLKQLADIFDVSVSELLSTPSVHVYGDGSPIPVAALPRIDGRRTEHDGGDISYNVLYDVEAPSGVADRHPESFFLKVDTDSMNKVYPVGCLILIDPDIVPQNGDAVVCKYEGGTILREWHLFTDTLVLTAASYTAYPDIVVRADSGVDVSGVVCWYQAEKDKR